MKTVAWVTIGIVIPNFALGLDYKPSDYFSSYSPSVGVLLEKS